MKKNFIPIIVSGMIACCIFTACNKQTAVPPAKPLTAFMVYNGASSYLNETSSVAISDSTGLTENLFAVYNTMGGGSPYDVGAINNARYYYFNPGSYRYVFNNPSGNAVSSGFLSMARDAHHTVYLSDSLGYFTTIVSDDDLIRPTDSAAIRLINLSPDAGPVDLAIDSNAVETAQAVKYGQISRFVNVPTTIKSGIRITTDSEQPQILSRKSFPLQSGRCYTLILRGYINPPAVAGQTESDRLNKTVSLSALINQ